MKRLLLLLGALGLIQGPASATWSVVVVNLATGEVAVASASCVAGDGLDSTVGVLVVGKGAGAAQAFVHSNAQNRKIMFKGFKDDLEPARILALIEASDNTSLRQFGIVSFQGSPVTFDGDGLTGDAFQFAGGVSGQVGDLLYAIQGNSLAGKPVIEMAEAALVNTPGPLSDKVMAAMVAAGAMGGDGRCSCGPDADSCGSPPPNFGKSAHQAFIALARVGDTSGKCNGSDGCVNGDYYLFLEETGGAADSDPVTRLAASYQGWRAALVGMADHYQSRVEANRAVIVADGRSRARVRVRLVDLDGTPLTQGGDTLTFKRLRGGLLRARPAEVIDHGDGSYTFDLIATEKSGREHWAVVVQRPGMRPVQLDQTVVIETIEPTEFYASHYSISLSADPALYLGIDRGAGGAGQPYLIAGTDRGTVPGFDLLGGVHVPLNRGRFMAWTLTPGPGRVDFSGLLDGEGRGEARLELPPLLGAALV